MLKNLGVNAAMHLTDLLKVYWLEVVHRTFSFLAKKEEVVLWKSLISVLGFDLRPITYLKINVWYI